MSFLIVYFFLTSLELNLSKYFSGENAAPFYGISYSLNDDLLLKFEKDTGEQIDLQLADYTINSVNVPFPEDKGAVEVEGEVVLEKIYETVKGRPYGKRQNPPEGKTTTVNSGVCPSQIYQNLLFLLETHYLEPLF